MASSPEHLPPQEATSPLNLSSSPTHNTIVVDSTMTMDTDIEIPPLPTTPSAQLLGTPTVGRTLDFDFSSDPLSPNAQTNPFSASLHPGPPTAKFIPRKRHSEATSSDDTRANSTRIQKPKTVQEAIQEARELLIKAFLLIKAYREQSKILDLLEIFKEYTETEKVLFTFKIVATQVTNLETMF